jgi:hypothetical protein
MLRRMVQVIKTNLGATWSNTLHVPLMADQWTCCAMTPMFNDSPPQARQRPADQGANPLSHRSHRQSVGSAVEKLHSRIRYAPCAGALRRRSDSRAIGEFLDWCARVGVASLGHVAPLHVATKLRSMRRGARFRRQPSSSGLPRSAICAALAGSPIAAAMRPAIITAVSGATPDAPGPARPLRLRVKARRNRRRPFRLTEGHIFTHTTSP